MQGLVEFSSRCLCGNSPERLNLYPTQLKGLQEDVDYQEEEEEVLPRPSFSIRAALVIVMNKLITWRKASFVVAQTSNNLAGSAY